MENKFMSRCHRFISVLLACGMVTLQYPSYADDGAPQSSEAKTEAVQAKAEPAPVLQNEGPVQGATSQEAAAPELAAKPVDAGSVTVNFKGADIKTVLAYLSEVSGVDIVPSPDVKGPVDLKLTNKPWKTALDILVRNYGYAYEMQGDIIRVATTDKLRQEELVTQEFAINYGDAKTISDSLKTIVTSRGSVVYDTRTNYVLVTDIPSNIYRVGQVISKLDKRTDQVLIEARVIETVLGKDERLGIDWSTKLTVAGAKRPMTFPFESFKTPFDSKSGEMQQFFPNVQTGTSSVTATAAGTMQTTTAEFPTGTTKIDYGFPFAGTDQFSFGTLDFTQFSAVMEFIRNRSDTNIVSNPRIATLNNKEASIMVGQTINLPTYERNSTTGRMEITGYTARDLGVKMKVTPHVNQNNEVVVDLAPEISDLLRYDTLDQASGVVAPVFSSRQAKTQIMVRDGETIFIGGLIKENEVDVKKKLPFIGDALGDIPFLGYLFSKKESTKQKTELIFFITVRLMAPNVELKEIPSPAKARVPVYEFTQQEDKKISRRKKFR